MVTLVVETMVLFSVLWGGSSGAAASERSSGILVVCLFREDDASLGETFPEPHYPWGIFES